MLKLIHELSSTGADTLHREARHQASSRVTLRRVLQRIERGPGQESVWDYLRPPRVEPVPERIRVVVDGVDVANSVDALRVLETAGPPVYYLPPADVRMDLLTVTQHTSYC